MWNSLKTKILTYSKGIIKIWKKNNIKRRRLKMKSICMKNWKILTYSKGIIKIWKKNNIKRRRLKMKRIYMKNWKKKKKNIKVKKKVNNKVKKTLKKTLILIKIEYPMIKKNLRMMILKNKIKSNSRKTLML